MADKLPTVWHADPHTFAKHAILECYLKAWFPILTRQTTKVSQGSKEVLFIDGFAGPGEYLDGRLGSPIIALNSVLDHDLKFPIPVHFLFIEHRPDRFEHLNNVLERFATKKETSKNVVKISSLLGDCDTVINQILDECEKKGTRFGPALAFLDQFGYAGVSMELIKRIIKYPQCEVFSYLDYKDMNRLISDPNKNACFNKTFGGDEWKNAINLPENERRKFLLNLYKRSLHEKANIQYSYAFSMFDETNRPLYWLVFSTQHLRGLELMKTAMWKVDKTGQFKFSDQDSQNQLNCLNMDYDQDWLAEELCAHLAGQELAVSNIKQYVLVETPCYLYKSALKKLETRKENKMNIVSAPSSRRPGTYPDNDIDKIVVRFPSRGLF